MSWDANPHMTAWLTVVNTALAAMNPPRAVYDYDDAPTTGGDYMILFLTRTSGGNARTPSGDRTSSWRLSVRSVGVGVTNARILLDTANAVIDAGRITVDNIVSTPAEFQTEDPIRQDEKFADLWSGLRSYTYVL